MEAVLDRIVDNEYAVLLLGETEEERIIPLMQMPDGAKEGLKYKLTFSLNEIVKIEAISEESMKSEALNDKLTMLRNRKQTRFKRK